MTLIINIYMSMTSKVIKGPFSQFFLADSFITDFYKYFVKFQYYELEMKFDLKSQRTPFMLWRCRVDCVLLDFLILWQPWLIRANRQLVLGPLGLFCHSWFRDSVILATYFHLSTDFDINLYEC